MSSWHKRLPALAFLIAAGFGANGCFSTASDDDDDDDGGEAGEGSVLGGSGGRGGTSPGTGGSTTTGGTGGSSTGGTTGGSTSPGTGGTNSAGTGTGGSGQAGSSPGSGGTGGGTGGSVSSGGSSGSGGTPPATAAIGAACESDTDCGDGLLCLTATSGTFGGESPAHGMCTASCTVDADCGGNAYCVPFDEAGTVSYCIEACETGTAGEPKCHERPGVACTLLGTVDTGNACTTIDDCGTGELCDLEAGTCGTIVPGCLSTCAGDFECESGHSCNFRTGFCAEGAASGEPIGAACDPTAATDPCNGFCLQSDDDETVGVCAAFCTLSDTFVGCGWDGTGSAEAGCIFGTVLSPPGDFGRGDLGLCAALCDCNEDCAVEGEFCMGDLGQNVTTIFGRAGYCRALGDDETESDTIACED